MAKFGYDVSYQKETNDANSRLEILEITKQYCFSHQDFVAYPDNIRAIRVVTFTFLKMLWCAPSCFSKPRPKDYFRRYFPDKGASPKQTYGKKIGLTAGQSILDR